MKPIGLGTITELLLKPYAILAGKENCEPCHCRRDKLNRFMPNAVPAIVAVVLLLIFIFI